MGGAAYLCYHPAVVKTTPNLVEGGEHVSPQGCEETRRPGAACGPEGTLFVQRSSLFRRMWGAR